MALLKVICWALIFIIRIRFPPGKSLATLLSVSRHAWWVDWLINGLKCFTAAAIPRGSISQGSHATWCLRNFALKKFGEEKFLIASNVCLVIAPSVTIHIGWVVEAR